MRIGHNGTVVCILCPKISTSLKKLAPTGLHGLHVFATLTQASLSGEKLQQTITLEFMQDQIHSLLTNALRLEDCTMGFH